MPQLYSTVCLSSRIVLRPVRMHMDIDSNMEMVGKRFPYYTQYEVCLSAVLCIAPYLYHSALHFSLYACMLEFVCGGGGVYACLCVCLSALGWL